MAGNRFAALEKLDEDKFCCKESSHDIPLIHRPLDKNPRSLKSVKIDRLFGRKWAEVCWYNVEPIKDSIKFRMVSYNVLAPSYAKQR